MNTEKNQGLLPLQTVTLAGNKIARPSFCFLGVHRVSVGNLKRLD